MKLLFSLLFSSLLVPSLFTPRSLGGVGLVPPVHAVSCLRSDSGDTTVNSACTLDGVPKYDGSGNETSRVGIINGGDLTISGADATVQPNTVIVWPLGKAINIQNGARLILGSGASLTQAEPLTYQFQSLGFTVNAAGDPVKVVNNVLQVCTNTTCSIAAPAGTGHAVVEGQLKVGSSFVIDGSGNVNLTGTIQNGGYTFLESLPSSNGDIYANIRVIRSKSSYADGMYINYGGTGGSAKIFDGGTVNYVSVNSGGNLVVNQGSLTSAGNINSTTGALQTAGITRVDNNGVGTFAAGTTIGGATVSSPSVSTKSTNFSVTSSDNQKIFLTTQALTITLPDATANSGLQFTVKNTGTGAIIIDTINSQQIEGYTSRALPSQYDAGTFLSNGTSWIIINKVGSVNPNAITDFGSYKGFGSGTYADSCLAYKNSPYYTGAAIGDGVYRVNISGGTLDVYCEMTTSGGGWTLVYSTNQSMSGMASITTSATVGTDAVRFNSNAKMSTALINYFFVSNEALVVNGSTIWTKFSGRTSNWDSYLVYNTTASYVNYNGTSGSGATYNNLNGYPPYYFFHTSGSADILYGGGYAGGSVCSGGWGGNGYPTRCGVLVR